MPEVVAKVAQEYAKRWIAPGERFHVEPQHVRILLAIGRIESPDPTEKNLQAAPAAGYRTRDMAAAVPPPKAPKKTRHRESILAKGR